MNVVAEEIELLRSIDEILKSKDLRAKIDLIVTEVEQKLAGQPDELLTYEPIPLSIYGEALPDCIRSSWVFILRAETITGAERHPNSHQRMMSYRGTGDMQTMSDDRWQSNFLVSDKDAGIEKRWVSIPTNVWHQPVVGKENWAVVAFHTVLDNELIEERPNSTDFKSTRQRIYLAQSHSD